MNQSQTKNSTIKTPIAKGSIFENCQGCIYIKDCFKFENCEFLQPKEKTKIELPTVPNSVIQNVKGKPKRKMPYGKTTSGDGITTLHRYHANIVNEALAVIRTGRTAYVYTQLVLKDIQTYEPNIEVDISDGIYYIRALNN